MTDVLDGSPALADQLYAEILLRHQPVPEDIAEALSKPANGGNGGNGGNGHSARETAAVGF